jgi:hypothetical protein
VEPEALLEGGSRAGGQGLDGRTPEPASGTSSAGLKTKCRSSADGYAQLQTPPKMMQNPSQTVSHHFLLQPGGYAASQDGSFSVCGRATEAHATGAADGEGATRGTDSVASAGIPAARTRTRKTSAGKKVFIDVPYEELVGRRAESVA